MEKHLKQIVNGSVILVLSLAGSFVMSPKAIAQNAPAKNPCDVVHDAFKKTFHAGSHMSIKNTGTVDVTKAQGTITGDGSYNESCTFLRDENLNGEAASVYREVMKAHSGTADGKIWISKSGGLVLQQDVNVEMGAQGKGEQIITFAYTKN
jgi:hypothetical protein